MKLWNYARNNQPCGPIDTADLQTLLRLGTLTPDSLVWTQGMTDWAAAKTIPEFAAITAAPATPPPLPAAPAAAPPRGNAPTPFAAIGAASLLPAFGVPPAGDSGVPPRNTPPTIAPTIPPEPAPTQSDIEENKIFAVLAYLGILFLVPLLAAPKSPYARFHTNQGIILFIAAAVAYPASWFLAIPLTFFTFGMGMAVPFLLAIGLLILAIIGIVNAATGQARQLPLIGHFEIMK